MVKYFVFFLLCFFAGDVFGFVKEDACSQNESPSFQASYGAKSGSRDIEITIKYSKNNFILLSMLSEPPIYSAVVFHENNILETYIIKGDNGIRGGYDFSIRNSNLFHKYHIADSFLFPERQQLSPTIKLGLTADRIEMSTGFEFSDGDLSCEWLEALDERQENIGFIEGKVIITNGNHEVVVESKTGLLLGDTYPNAESPNRSITLSDVRWENPHLELRDYIPEFDRIKIKSCSEKEKETASVAVLKGLYRTRFRTVKILSENIKAELRADGRVKGMEHARRLIEKTNGALPVEKKIRDYLLDRNVALNRDNLDRAVSVLPEALESLNLAGIENLSVYANDEDLPKVITVIDYVWNKGFLSGFMETLLLNIGKEKNWGSNIEHSGGLEQSGKVKKEEDVDR